MAKRVSAVEKMAADFVARLLRLIPDEYLRNPDPNDELNGAWNAALEFVIEAVDRIEKLGDLVRTKGAWLTGTGRCVCLQQR